MKPKFMKPWSLKRADDEFSLYIRGRDKRCMNPRCPKRETLMALLQCSHYWPRWVWTTRYDPDNCVALCKGCHLYKWEQTKQGDYTEFMKHRLGQSRFIKLKLKAEDYIRHRVKITHRAEIDKVYNFLKNHDT